MKKLITAILAVLILGSGMGIGADTLVATSADSGPVAKPVSYDMGITDSSIYRTLKMGDTDTVIQNEKGSFQFELVYPSATNKLVGMGANGGTIVFDGVSSYFTYTRPADDSDATDSFLFRICRPADKKNPRICGTPALATINWDLDWTIPNEGINLHYTTFADSTPQHTIRDVWVGDSSKFIVGMDDADMTGFKIKVSNAASFTDVVLESDGTATFKFLPDSADGGKPVLGYHLWKDLTGNYYFQFWTLDELAPGTTYDVLYEATDGVHTQHGSFTVSFNPLG